MALLIESMNSPQAKTQSKKTLFNHIEKCKFLLQFSNAKNLPFLKGNGFWHTQHWIGAVLTAYQLTIHKLDQTDEMQKQQVKDFLNSAINASKILLIY